MHPSMHGLIVTADNRQSTKLAVAANFSSCIGFRNTPMATMIATGCERHRREPHAGMQL